MTIQYCSDLHLEQKENAGFIAKHPIIPKAELLLLAGDILPFHLDHRNYAFFDYLSDNFETVYWIPGNHEYYGSDISCALNPLHEEIRPRVFRVNNCTLCYKDVTLVASTLWSSIDPANYEVMRKRLSDFREIRHEAGPLLPDYYNVLHLAAVNFLKEELNTYQGRKQVVLTHHLPTFTHYPTKFRNDPLKEGFATELRDLIEGSAVSAWIYGHHHCNVQPFYIGGTRLLTNQLGYVRRREHKSFSREAVFTI